MKITNLRNSNVSKYLPILSNDDVIKELMSPAGQTDTSAQQNENFIEKLFVDNSEAINFFKTAASSNTFGKPS